MTPSQCVQTTIGAVPLTALEVLNLRVDIVRRALASAGAAPVASGLAA
jgi:hypothetical protein